MINFRRLHEKCFEVTSHYADVYGILEHATVAQGSIYSRDHLCLCKENSFLRASQYTGKRERYYRTGIWKKFQS